MAKPLRVVALISGGKDSLFSILHCTANEHAVVALANLYPDNATNDADDIDSFMYQTVGHRILPLYEEALGIPLYRQPIHGTNLVTSQDYDSHQARGGQGSLDETESLIPLLERVKRAHPEINAVSTGAILSTYQRTRIESVALRLGLVPLAFLWQYPYLPPAGHATLLHDMASVGAEARIIKTSSGGLSDDHIWMDVSDPSTILRLQRDMERFGGLEVGSLLGEGGEYETLAVNGPKPLWKKRINAETNHDRAQGTDGGAFVAKIVIANLVEDDQIQAQMPRMPPLLDEVWQHTLDKIDQSYPKLKDDHSDRPIGQAWLHSSMEAVYERNDSIYLLNIVPRIAEETGQSSTIHDQMAWVSSRLRILLQQSGVHSDNVISTTILLRSMSDFAEINTIYKKLFSRLNPPSRVTIACGDMLPPDVGIVLSAVATRLPVNQRKALHVQSRSYWAPANIGPYSQATLTPLQQSREVSSDSSAIVYIAGQIPLVPASMEIVHGPFATQVVLALQHLWRVGRAMQVHWWTSGLGFITATSYLEAQARAEIARSGWVEATTPNEDDNDEESEDIDIADLKLHRSWAQIPQAKPQSILSPIPDWSRATGTDHAKLQRPQCFIAQIDELPRGVSVEWTGLGLHLSPSSCVRASSSPQKTFCSDESTGTLWTTIAISTGEDMHEAFMTLGEYGDRLEFLEACIRMPARTEHLQKLHTYRAQIVPCRTLWSESAALECLLRCRLTGSQKAESINEEDLGDVRP